MAGETPTPPPLDKKPSGGKSKKEDLKMAIGRLSVKVGKVGKASAHAKYIFREGKYAKSDELEDLEYQGHGNMPKWAENDPNFFWQCADNFERKNGSTYREHEIALPRELTAEQRLELVRDWIEQEIGDKHAYQYAIHNPPALDGDEQPHVHLMFSDRLIDDIERDPDQYFKRYNSKHPERGGAKKANTAKLSSQRKAELKEQRERWQIVCNNHLKKAGIRKTINMKSYADRGIRYKPLNIPMQNFQSKNTPQYQQKYKEQLRYKKEYFELSDKRSQIDIHQELERLRNEPEISEHEQFLAYKAMLYISERNNTLDEKFDVYPLVRYDDRQVQEIMLYRKENDLNFWGFERELPYDHPSQPNRPQRMKDHFIEPKNLAKEDTQKIIKIIAQPELEREEYNQQKNLEKSDPNSSVQKLQNDVTRNQTRRFRR